MIAYVTPIQQRVDELLPDPAELQAVLAKGADRAREVCRLRPWAGSERLGFLPAQ